MIEENKNTYISYWLLLITFLVALMIVVGGLTRLTDSGLSITRWDLFSGIIPPLNTEDWKKYFSLYRNRLKEMSQIDKLLIFLLWIVVYHLLSGKDYLENIHFHISS